ncbi:hypothetical protein JXA40_07760 [bacterium]|nr:hypothetical protein [candidate division CSSED10-310 bacterium]
MLAKTPDIRRIKILMCWAAILVFGIGFAVRPLWEDEIEHLHCAYLTHLGQKPHIDFFQNHPPALHLLLSGLMMFAPMGIAAVFCSRLLVLTVLTASAIILAGMLDKIHRLDFWFLCISLPVYWVLYHLRPDPFMIFMVALHIVCIKKWTDSGKRSALIASGIFLGASACFTPKTAILWIGVPIVLMMRASKRRELQSPALFLAGVSLMPLALAIYLVMNNLGSTFVGDVLALNRQPILGSVEYSKLPALSWNGMVMLVWILGNLRNVKSGSFPVRSLFDKLIAIYSLLAFAAFFIAPFGWQYNLALWIVFVAMQGPRLWSVILESVRPAHRLWIQLVLVFGLTAPPLIAFISDCASVHESAWRIGQFRFICSRVHRGQSVVAVAPLHPVFVRDAAGIYHPWQFFFARSSQRVRTRWFSGWFDDFSTEPPDLIDAGYLTAILDLTPENRNVMSEVNELLLEHGYLEYRHQGRIYFVKP